jgi:hypothetical protein
VGLERGPLGLVSETEELLGRNSIGSSLEIREYSGRDPSRSPRETLYPQMLALTSTRSGGRSVGIVRSRTETMEFGLVLGRSLVVKAVGYKPEGRGFENRWGEILHLPNPSGRTRPWGLLSL